MCSGRWWTILFTIRVIFLVVGDREGGVPVATSISLSHWDHLDNGLSYSWALIGMNMSCCLHITEDRYVAQAELLRRGEIGHEKPPGWPSKKVKSDGFSPTLIAKDTCQTLDGPSQVFDWSSHVLRGCILDLKWPVYILYGPCEAVIICIFIEC